MSAIARDAEQAQKRSWLLKRQTESRRAEVSKAPPLEIFFTEGRKSLAKMERGKGR